MGAESPTIEYQELMTDTIARGVATLGHAYAGLLLVGVSDDRAVRGVKEKTIDSVSAKGIMPSRFKRITR